MVGIGSIDWMLFTGFGVLVLSKLLISGFIKSWAIQSRSSKCSSGSAFMMDLMALGFTVVFDDFDFLEELDERDFLDLDECDFLDLDECDFLDFEVWLSPLELREAKERVDPMMESLFVSTIVSNSSTAC